ncbi:uncharacterized protein LOC143352338 isoform X1 [Halictus rubicundus]|uniref:uncharacterized protein LOC143352338 isoform X1 n=1 Tax=Halictus rubicundus TaxID=77578 RepID=UPI0040358E31
MADFQRLRDAVAKLHQSVSNFRVGAVSLDDYKPTEDRIKNMRDTLTQLNARLLMLKAHDTFRMCLNYSNNKEQFSIYSIIYFVVVGNTEILEENIADSATKLHNATSDSLLNNKAIKICLHSYTIQSILAGNEGDKEKQMKINACMHTLFTINDEMLTIQKEIDKAVQKQLDLKIECQNMLFEHKKFLEEQEEVRNKRLQEKNPEIARNKKKLIEKVDKINIMKKLIVNFIAASSHLLMKESMLVEMLEKHRDLVNIDTILKMAQSSAEN